MYIATSLSRSMYTMNTLWVRSGSLAEAAIGVALLRLMYVDKMDVSAGHE